MCFHKICLPITIYCAMNPTAISLICIIKLSHTTGLFSFGSQTRLAIFFNLKPNQNNKQATTFPGSHIAYLQLPWFSHHYSKCHLMNYKFAAPLSSSSVLSSSHSNQLRTLELFWKNHSMVIETSSCHTQW